MGERSRRASPFRRRSHDAAADAVAVVGRGAVPLALRRPQRQQDSRNSSRPRRDSRCRHGDDRICSRRVEFCPVRRQLELARADLAAGQLHADPGGGEVPPLPRQRIHVCCALPRRREADAERHCKPHRGPRRQHLSPWRRRRRAGHADAAAVPRRPSLARPSPVLRVLPRRDRPGIGRLSPDRMDRADRQSRFAPLSQGYSCLLEQPANSRSGRVMSAQTTIEAMSGAKFAAAPSAVLIVYAGALLQGMTLVSFPAVSAMLKQTLALSDADYGAIFLPQVALAIVGAVAGGALARKIGLKALFAVALAANATSQVLLAGSDFASPSGGVVLLLAGTASLGLGFGLIGGPINAYPALLFPHRSQTAIVAAHTLIGLGLAIAIGPLIAGLFVAAGAWSGFPISLGSACAIAAVAALLIRLPQSATPVAADETKPTRPAASPIFWLFAAITVIYAFAEGTFSSWAVIFLRDGKGLPDMTASFALSAFWGALVAGRLLVSVLIVRVPAYRAAGAHPGEYQFGLPEGRLADARETSVLDRCAEDPRIPTSLHGGTRIRSAIRQRRGSPGRRRAER